jgi:uridylate kinase
MMVTLCFGGSIVVPNLPDVKCIREIVRGVRRLKSKGHGISIVVGGGKTARNYIRAAEELEFSKKDLDMLGIAITRVNARLLINALGELAEPEPVTDYDNAVKSMLSGKIPVMGGISPGQTTDAVAAMLAEVSRSDLLIFFTDVDGVYTADPKLHPNAKKIERMKADQLFELVSKVQMRPGVRTIMDPIAARIIERSRVLTLVLGRREIRRLPQIVEGKKHSGTIIEPVA